MKRVNTIGRNIAKLRRLKGWSQEVMASKMQCLGGLGRHKAYDMTRQVVGNIESERQNIYHWHIEVIREVLGCTYDDIFHGPKVSRLPPRTLYKKLRKRRRR